MATSARRRRKKPGGDHGGHADERWLVSFADMMTLLVALFMVLFSISSVNKSKFESLQRSLQDSFAGRILPGGKSIKESGGSASVPQSLPNPPYPSLQPIQGGKPADREGTAGAAKEFSKREQQDFERLQRRVEQIAREQGLSGQVTTRITDDGLVIRVLSDDLLFESGSAAVREESKNLLTRLGGLLATERRHVITVEGHTDRVPITSRQYPTNWELSTARATSITRDFIAAGVNAGRMTAAGRAYLEPAASNDTPAGRSLNRRVEILLPRLAN